ncbi:MAG: SGNH/GDSL hydrolase family protein [Candidatus Krumholzibacteriia bacterium]
MKKMHRIVAASIGGLLMLAGPATPAAAAGALPQQPSELLLVGDSVTAGIYFLSLSDTSIRQSWAGQLMRRLGIAPERGRFEKPYPINHLGLARLGFTVGGLAYPWEALRVLLPASPRFAAGDERVVMAVPGQMLREVIGQSSKNRGDNSSGWTFGEILLPEGLSVVETVEQWQKRPRWVVLFIGANDLLASFGIVGNARSPSPGEFRRDYARLVERLRGVMPGDVGADHFLVLTLPDVTALPLLQPLPEGADDGHGRPYPAGSVASAFLVPFRSHFEADEVWTPGELEAVRRLVRGYNDAIRGVAEGKGLTVVDLTALLGRLGDNPSFATATSPYFSPDLHHPSCRTHGVIAGAVLDAMAGVAGVGAPPAAETRETPLPHNGDFSPVERARVNAMVRLGLQGLRQGPLPPKPTYRFSLDVGGQGGNRRSGRGALSIMAGVESTPSPVSTRWLSRGGFHVRLSPLVLERNGGGVDGFPKTSLEARAGIAIERIGGWHWMRFGSGVLYAAEGGFGWYTRGEWRLLYGEVSSRDGDPDRIEGGLRLGWFIGRPGRNGN